MDTQTFKPGDFVRLTDPISNVEVVRIESVDEHGYASWFGGSQKGDMTQISVLNDGDSPIGNDIDGYFFLVSEIVEEIEKRVNAQTWLNLKRPFKLYPESAVNYWKHRAEIAEQIDALNEKLLKEEHNQLLDAQDYIKKVCKESSADIQKLDAENKKLKERNDALNGQNEALEAQLKKAQSANVEFFDNIKRLEAENEKLKQKLSELQTAVYDWGETEDVPRDLRT